MNWGEEKVGRWPSQVPGAGSCGSRNKERREETAAYVTFREQGGKGAGSAQKLLQEGVTLGLGVERVRGQEQVGGVPVAS